MLLGSTGCEGKEVQKGEDTRHGFVVAPRLCCFRLTERRIQKFSLLANTDAVLPPIPTTNLTADDVEELTRYTREIMLRALTKLTESPPGQRAYRADGTFTPITKSQHSADSGGDDKGTSSAVAAADGAGDELRRNVVQKETEKRAAEDGLAQ